jgi:hypothetical protein
MKPFDQELYDADDDAKLIVIEWLKAFDFDAHVNPDQYGIDILASKRKNDYAFEVEVKHNWTGEYFPYETVHFSSRKQKFLDDARQTFFVMLNHDLTHGLIVTREALKSSDHVRKDTKYTSDESFMSVPIERCGLVRLAAA